MNADFENELRGITLRQVPAEWKTRILARAVPPGRKASFCAFLWPHPALWAGVALAWVAAATLNLTGPRGDDLYAFGGKGSEPSRISPEAYARYITRCAFGPGGENRSLVPRRCEL